MAYRDGDELVTFEGVVAIDKRPLEKQEVSVLCRLPDGREKFVSRNQVPPWQDFPEDESPFTLEVTAWLAGKWEEEPPEEHVTMRDVVVLREGKPDPGTGLPKAIQVRLADGNVEWVPTRGICPGSPVSRDGDRGDLWLRMWIAKAKGLGGDATSATDRRQTEVPGARRERGPRIGDDARSGYRGDAVDYESFAEDHKRNQPEPDPGPLDDDDPLPF